MPAKTEQELVKFYEDLNQEIVNKASIDEEEDFRENIFTEVYIDDLVEAAEIEYGNISYHESRGVKINGYCFPEDDTDLILFVSIYNNKPEIYNVAPSDAKKMLERLKTFYIKSTEGYYADLEDAYGTFDIAKYIYDNRKKIETVHLMLLTNALVSSTYLPSEDHDNVTFISQIWDIQRIFRLLGDPSNREKIEISMSDYGVKGLSCIAVKTPEVAKQDKNGNEILSGGYTSYFTVIPGEVLFKIYDQYNARLLEKNVRAFLQARGSVNKGIKNTIINQPEMFLAYNNGISATAESVTAKDAGNGTCLITGLKDFQIVNGGQTTASIFNTCVKNRLPLSSINVQAKITVLDHQEQMNVVVPKISLYANSQNKVQQADFSANDAFHQELEKLSRNEWAPGKNGGEQQTKWFYERSRGQYADTRSREKNKKYFDSIYPKNQYFDKIQLARYCNVWDQLPYITSKGGQASFSEFTIRLKEEHRALPDRDAYHDIIAKAILYMTVRAIVKRQNFQGFWADVADYTTAYLSYKTAKRINLVEIWKTQDVPESLQNDAEAVANAIYTYLVDNANGRNIQQWCKQKECWEGIKTNVLVPLSQETVRSLGKPISSKSTPASMTDSSSDALAVDLYNVEAEVWWKLSAWGKETEALQSFQRGIAYSLGKLKKRQTVMSSKQALQGLKILKAGYEQGFLQDEEIKKLLDKYAASCNM